jgi:hypothetical protein
MRSLSLTVAIAITCTFALKAQHLHFVAGVDVPVQGAKLLAVNSNDFVLSSGYVRTMTLATTGVRAGLWAVSHPFVVAAATPPAEEGAPAFGSWIHMSMVSATGPAGGELAFWEVNATTPTIRLRVGETSTELWLISENDGSPGSDPYGHIHGRNFTATLPGLYIIAFRFVDRSTNGIGGGPIHAPSDLIYVAFQAGITVSQPKKESDAFSVLVGTQIGRSHTLEYTSDLGSAAVWMSGPSVSGNDHFQPLTDSNPTDERRFYRIRHALEE